MRASTARTVHRFLAFMTIGAVIAAAAIFGTAVAKADGIINATEAEYVAAYGEFVVCDSLAGNPTPAGVVAVVKAIMGDGFTADSSVDILNASVLSFCDYRWPLLQKVGRMARGEQQA